jgi:hypothetical protein
LIKNVIIVLGPKNPKLKKSVIVILAWKHTEKKKYYNCCLNQPELLGKIVCKNYRNEILNLTKKLTLINTSIM